MEGTSRAGRGVGLETGGEGRLACVVGRGDGWADLVGRDWVDLNSCELESRSGSGSTGFGVGTGEGPCEGVLFRLLGLL
jgi:hypothetical protein